MSESDETATLKDRTERIVKRDRSGLLRHYADQNDSYCVPATILEIKAILDNKGRRVPRLQEFVSY